MEDGLRGPAWGCGSMGDTAVARLKEKRPNRNGRGRIRAFINDQYNGSGCVGERGKHCGLSNPFLVSSDNNASISLQFPRSASSFLESRSGRARSWLFSPSTLCVPKTGFQETHRESSPPLRPPAQPPTSHEASAACTLRSGGLLQTPGVKSTKRVVLHT